VQGNLAASTQRTSGTALGIWPGPAHIAELVQVDVKIRAKLGSS